MKTIRKQVSSSAAKKFEEWKIAKGVEEKAKTEIAAKDLWDCIGEIMELETGEKINPKKELQLALLQEQGYICCYCGKRIDETNMRIEHFFPKTHNKPCTYNYYNLHAACKGGGEGYCFIGQEGIITRRDICEKYNIQEDELLTLNKKNKGWVPQKGDKVKVYKDPYHCDNLKDSHANNPNYQSGQKDKNGNTSVFSSPFILSPLLNDIETRFKYLNDGKIVAQNDSDLRAKDTLTLLGLTLEPLNKERRKIVKVANKLIEEKYDEFGSDIDSFIDWLKQELDALYQKEKLDEFCFVTAYFFRTNIPQTS
ncbi:MAG: retron system putative HNH endonuclease [Bacteroidia bacterium]